MSGWPHLSQCAILAGIAYMDDIAMRSALEGMGYQLVVNVEVPDTDTGCYIAEAWDGSLIWGWRGTRSRRNWLIDADVVMCDYPGLPGSRVHRGFWTATDSVFREHHERFPRQSCFARRITFLGHSLGGACATLAAHMLCRDSSHVDVVTFGCPRVGDGSFVRDYNARVPDTIRIVHDEDDIPRLPPEFLGYEHVDGLLHLYDGGIPRNRLHAIWDWITAAEKRVIADVDGEGIRDHFMQRYIDTVKLYDVRQECA